MFLDVIEISSKRKSDYNKTSLNACVFPIETVEPFIDTDTQSEVKHICVVIHKSDWPFKNLMAIGDTITEFDSTTWKITDVSLEQDDIKITARGTK